MPEPAFARAKRVTDPLDDKVKARLRGDDEHLPPAKCGCSSGNENGTADLSGFVCGFFFSDSEQGVPERDDRLGGVVEDDASVGQCSFYAVPSAGMIRDLVNPRAASPVEDRFKRDLEADAAAAAASFAGLRPNPASFRRAVVESLRGIGYNAGICNSRWESGGGGLVAGTYEYIDVLTSSPQRRYIVDVDFAGEFDIARPTVEYVRLAAELPRVFVGSPEGLRRLLRLLADAARRSLRSREMHVPPWRRTRYLQAKWLGPYRRTVSPRPPPPTSSSSSSSATAPAPPSAVSFSAGRGEVKCRFVGFDAASSPVIAPVSRTR